MYDILKDLNPAQREAVTTTEGFVRIIAGAGSGKTRALSRRFAYLVNELGILPGNILCVTFTNKAANYYASNYSDRPISELLSALLDQSGYEKMLRTEGNQERLDNLAELKQSVYEYETTCGRRVCWSTIWPISPCSPTAIPLRAGTR